ncbi:hypothetical protein ACO0M4_13370 [Streptomyces sp. RGM 3693]|uniref:hypothetical protein n=1 Tax=Streptomyces sp. RGM 3693 TaxID=3413284 RepID=UPI003D2CB1BD
MPGSRPVPASSARAHLLRLLRPVISAGALVRDHTIIGLNCHVGFASEITRTSWPAAAS